MPNRLSTDYIHGLNGSATVLRAKLRLPRAHEDQIPRPRLIERLQQGLGRRMTIVSGPSGYGKTTTVTEWMRQSDRPIAWLTLDPLDNDPMSFLRVLVAVINNTYPNSTRRTKILLMQPKGAPAGVMADALIEDLADLPGRLILTLDEFHMMSNSDVLTLVSRLVQFLPSNVHLVLVGRTAPPLPLSLLRARGALSELQATDLRFDSEEIQQFLSLMTGQQANKAAAAQFARLTEGWPGILHLAVLARQTAESIDELAVRLAGGGRSFAAGFLLDEVLSHQPEDTQQFLLQTSILTEFNDSLCAAVVCEDKCASRLNHLYRANLLIALDDDRTEWYRHHPLLHDLLQDRLRDTADGSFIRALHCRAGDWFAAAGRIDEAISHALAAGNDEAAAKLVEDHVHLALNNEELWRVTRRLRMLPERARRRPSLLIAQAWINIQELRIEAVGRVLMELQTALATWDLAPEQQQQMQGQIALINATAIYLSDSPRRALDLATRGLAAVPLDMVYARSHGIHIAVLSRYIQDGPAAAQEELTRRLATETHQTPVLLARTYIAQGYIHIESSDTYGTLRTCKTIEQVAARSSRAVSSGWAEFGRGLVAYEWNDLANAEKHLRRAISEPYRLFVRAVIESFILLSLTLAAMGRASEAEEIVDRLREFIVESDNLHFMPVADATEMRLSPERLGALGQVLTTPPQMATGRRELLFSLTISPTLELVRGLLTRPTPERLANAAAHLEVMYAAAVALRAVRRQVEILTLQALVHDASGREAEAFDTLHQALVLAEPGRLIRTVIDCGPELGPLLQRAAAAGESSPAVDRLLGALAGAEIIKANELAAATSAEVATMRSVLTERETQVLQMLAQRLSNKEIAAALVLTPDTVRRYTTRIYRKLGVRNRRAAVTYAETLGLLDTPHI